MKQVFLKEFNSFLNALIAYIAIGVFLTSIGLLMWVFPDTSVLNYGYADMEQLFALGPYVFIFLVPAITMKSFAEEKKSGTFEALLTKPLSDTQIIMGKYLACWALVLIALAPTLIYYFSIFKLGNPVGNVDTPGVIGSYIGIVLLAGIFCAIGVFASSIAPNQIVSFILSAFLCFVFYSGLDSLSGLFLQGEIALAVKQLGIRSHYETLSKGLIDSRDVVYFFSVIALLFLFTKTLLRQS